YIYQQNTIKGNKPIKIAHSYSILSILPEKETANAAPWSIPISGERVSLDKTSVDVGSEQISEIMCDSSLAWHEKLCVLVGDTAYSQRSFLFEQSKHKNLVVPEYAVIGFSTNLHLLRCQRKNLGARKNTVSDLI
ncbi:MAG: hypothetical protein V7K49_18055, partial [Nostoc sp.]